MYVGFQFFNILKKNRKSFKNKKADNEFNFKN